jgi:hypothetical protein
VNEKRDILAYAAECICAQSSQGGVSSDASARRTTPARFGCGVEVVFSLLESERRGAFSFFDGEKWMTQRRVLSFFCC